MWSGLFGAALITWLLLAWPPIAAGQGPPTSAAEIARGNGVYGYRFRGRGLIQLTGRSNYEQYSAAVDVDFLTAPHLVAALPWCVDVAGWYWETRALNRWADRDDLRQVTRPIGQRHEDLAALPLPLGDRGLDDGDADDVPLGHQQLHVAAWREIRGRSASRSGAELLKLHEPVFEPIVQGAAPDEGVRRRDFLHIAAVSVAGVGGVALVYPLVNQMNPSADVLALASIDVDISAIQPGQRRSTGS